jgi:hypothetical protein
MIPRGPVTHFISPKMTRREDAIVSFALRALCTIHGSTSVETIRGYTRAGAPWRRGLRLAQERGESDGGDGGAICGGGGGGTAWPLAYMHCT